MTTAKILIARSAARRRRRGPARKRPSQPEVFTGTAQVKNATGAVSGTLEVRLRRVTPEFDRKAVETALKEGGYPRFLTAIRNAPEVGQLVLGGGEPFAIRYARERIDATGPQAHPRHRQAGVLRRRRPAHDVARRARDLKSR